MMKKILLAAIFVLFSTMAWAATPTNTPTWTPTASPTPTQTMTLTPASGMYINHSGVTLASTRPFKVAKAIISASTVGNVTVNFYDGTTQNDTYDPTKLVLSIFQTTTTVPITIDVYGIFKRGIVVSTVGTGTPAVGLTGTIYQ